MLLIFVMIFTKVWQNKTCCNSLFMTTLKSHSMTCSHFLLTCPVDLFRSIYVSDNYIFHHDPTLDELVSLSGQGVADAVAVVYFRSCNEDSCCPGSRIMTDSCSLLFMAEQRNLNISHLHPPA